jgi:hypothetical protein
MEPFQDHLDRRERWATQDPKVTEVLLDHEVFLGHLALKGRRERKETKVTKSMLGGGREVLPPSHELALAVQPLDQFLQHTWARVSDSLQSESWSLSRCC